MAMAELKPDDPLSPQTVNRLSFLCKLAVVVGLCLHVVFYTGPPRPLTLSVFLIGGGLAGYSFIFLYQNQPQMTASHLLPYLLGLLIGVSLIAVGIGYEFVDRRVGLPFLVVVAATVIVFARYFTYAPEN